MQINGTRRMCETVSSMAAKRMSFHNSGEKAKTSNMDKIRKRRPCVCFAPGTASGAVRGGSISGTGFTLQKGLSNVRATRKMEGIRVFVNRPCNGGVRVACTGETRGNDRECGNDEMVKKAGRAGGTRPLPEGSRLGGLVTCRLEVAR